MAFCTIAGRASLTACVRTVGGLRAHCQGRCFTSATMGRSIDISSAPRCHDVRVSATDSLVKCLALRVGQDISVAEHVRSSSFPRGPAAAVNLNEFASNTARSVGRKSTGRAYRQARGRMAQPARMHRGYSRYMSGLAKFK